MSVIKRAARALALKESGTDCYDDLDEAQQQTLDESVRVVLEAIREPGNEIYQAGFDAEATANPYKTQPHHVVPAVWRAMIDAALSE